MAPEDKEEKDNIYLTGVNLGSKRGSTVSEMGKEKKKGKFGDRHAQSTISYQKPVFRYFSDYDANLNQKFKIKKYEKNIVEQFSAAKRRFNFGGLLKNLREAFEQKSQVEVTMMEQKNTSFMKALNQIIYEK